MDELRVENMSLKQGNFSKEPSMMKSWLISVFLDFFCSHKPSTCSSNLSYLSNWIPNRFSLLLSTIALSQSKLSFLQFLWAIQWHWSRPPDFMRKKCPCSGGFGTYIPAFGMNTEIYGLNLRIQSECWKMRTWKTPNTGTFWAM